MCGTKQPKADIAVQQRSKQNDHRRAVPEIPKTDRRHRDTTRKRALLDREVGAGCVGKLRECFVELSVRQPLSSGYSAMFERVSEPIRETQRSAFLYEGLRNLINHLEKG